MASWDFFHSERLEVRRGLDAVQVRAALARGELRDGDLIRPAGTGAPWARLADQLALLGPEPPPSLSPTSRIADDRSASAADRPEPRPEDDPRPRVRLPVHRSLARRGGWALVFRRHHHRRPGARPDARRGPGARPHAGTPRRPGGEEPEGDAAGAEVDPLEEDETVAEFTLTRGGAEKVEELDLAAMVDVAFQLVLFFLVTATTVLYKTLEVPRPNPERSPAAGLPPPASPRRGGPQGRSTWPRTARGRRSTARASGRSAGTATRGGGPGGSPTRPSTRGRTRSRRRWRPSRGWPTRRRSPLTGAGRGSDRECGGEGMSDRRAVDDASEGREARAAVPPRRDAEIKRHGDAAGPRLARDEDRRRIGRIGRAAWEEESGYRERSPAEAGMSRMGTILGGGVAGRSPASRRPRRASGAGRWAS